MIIISNLELIKNNYEEVNCYSYCFSFCLSAICISSNYHKRTPYQRSKRIRCTYSSGSPLINNSHSVIGQLRGSNLSCTYLTGTSKFGKFSVSWTGNGNSDYRRRLNYWLNPNGYNIQSLSGLNPYGVSGPSYIIQSTPSGVYSINNLPSIYTVSWSLSDSYYNQNCLQQNYPSQNQCTITRSSSYNMMNATLTAEIKYNGVTIQTLTKTGIYAYNDFWGNTLLTISLVQSTTHTFFM